jgi:hypothetical protein
MKSMFFGKKLVSVPFAPYGGACADNGIIENALVEDAKRITSEEAKRILSKDSEAFLAIFGNNKVIYNSLIYV